MPNPTIGIYRIVGAELPPRDIPGTRVRTVSRILEEELPPNSQQHWLVNRILDHATRRELQRVLDCGKARYAILPMDTAAVRASSSRAEQLRHVIAINTARNWAISDGNARGYDWIVVLDGDCMFTPEGYRAFYEKAATTTVSYLGIPSQRAIMFGDGLVTPVAEPNEPMLAFRKGAERRFNEHLAFGENEKLKLCAELGYSMVPGTHATIATPGVCENAGTVLHLCCDAAAERIETEGPLRNSLREEGLTRLLDHALAPRPANAYAPFNQEWKEIPGFFDFLGPYSSMAADIPDGQPIGEVGCWLGKSLHYLARELQLRGKTNQIYAIDTWSGDDTLAEHVAKLGGPDKLYQMFLQNMRQFAGRVLPIRMPSVEAAALFPDEFFGALFLDANHSYEAVRADLEAWYPKVRHGGLIFGHDYIPTHLRSLGGVVRAVDEFFADDSIECRPASRVWKHVRTSEEPRIWA